MTSSAGTRGRFSLVGLLGQESLYLLLVGSMFLNIIFVIMLDSRTGPPPIIDLNESKGYAFESGKATLTPEFTKKLQGEVADLLVQNASDYGATIVEVIGHTDGQPEGGGESTLDKDLLRFIMSEPSLTEAPITADNTGLGMARAAAVAQVLRANPRTKHLVFLPYSAGQAVLRAEQLALPTDKAIDATRRRIEIRLRRPTDLTNAPAK